MIYAGLNYAPGSLKALLCVKRRTLVFEYCVAHGVTVRQCGKLIVAVNDADVSYLEIIARVRWPAASPRCGD